MAVAGHAQLDRIGASSRPHEQDIAAWRLGLKYAYFWALCAVGIGLIVVFPPSFDFTLTTVLSVALVSVFLALNERPQQGFQISHAPLSAILAAGAAAVGWWALPLGIVGLSAAHWRLRGEGGRSLSTFVASLAGQFGAATLAVYAMMASWAFVTHSAHLVPPVLSTVVVFLGIVAIGMTWQTVNNALAITGFAIIGQPASFVRYWRAGFVASLWAYLLVGMYTFGGIVGAVVFYYVVAHTRMFDRIIKAVEARDERDFVATQFHQMVREFVGLLSPKNAEFAGDVRYLAMQMGRKVGLVKNDLENLGWAAEFHEIGKCKLTAGARDGVNLTPAQQQERLRYPMLGAQVLRKAPKIIPEEVAYAVEHQCEAFDGSGYPHGIRAGRIPVASRIIAIARDYLQMLEGHDGAVAQSKGPAIALLQERAGTQYDPALVDLLCHEIA